LSLRKGKTLDIVGKRKEETLIETGKGKKCRSLRERERGAAKVEIKAPLLKVNEKVGLGDFRKRYLRRGRGGGSPSCCSEIKEKGKEWSVSPQKGAGRNGLGIRDQISSIEKGKAKKTPIPPRQGYARNYQSKGGKGGFWTCR